MQRLEECLLPRSKGGIVLLAMEALCIIDSNHWQSSPPFISPYSFPSDLSQLQQLQLGAMNYVSHMHGGTWCECGIC